MTRSRRRRLLAAAGLTTAALLLALLLGAFPQEPVRSRLEAALRSATGPGSRIGSASLRPGLLQVALRDVVIEGPGYRVALDRLEARLAPATLLGRGVHLRRLAGEGLAIELRSTGVDGAAEPSTPGQPGFAGPLVVDSVELAGPRASWQGAAGGRSARLDGIVIRGAIGHGTLNVETRGGSLEGPAAAPLAPLRLVLRIAPDLAIDVETASAGLGQSRLDFSGRLGRPGALDPDLAFEAALAVPDLAGLALAAPPETGGELQVEGRLRGPLEAPRVEARVTGQDLRWHAPVERLSGRVEVEGERARVDVEAELLGGTLQAWAVRRDGNVEAEAALAGVRLEALRGLGLSGIPPAGEARATIRAHGPAAGPWAVSLDAGARASESSLVAEARGTLAEGGRLDAGWNATVVAPAGTARLDGSARAGARRALEVDGTLQAEAKQGLRGVTARGAFALRGPTLSARAEVLGLGAPARLDAVHEGGRFRSLVVDAPALDLARITDGGATGTAQLRLDLSGPPEALDGSGSVRVAQARWREVDLGPLDLALEATAGIAQVEASAPGLAARARARVATADRRATGRLDVDGADLARLAPLAGGPLEGVARARVEFDVPLDAPRAARVEAAIERLDVARGPWRVSTDDARLAVRDGWLEIARLVLEGAGARLDAKGRVALDADPELELELRGSADLAATPREPLAALAGRVALDARVSGTAAEPRAEGLARVEDLRIEAPGAPPLEAARVDLALVGDRARLQAAGLALAGGALELGGEFPFGEAPARLELSWRGVDGGALVRAANPASEPLDARLDGRLEATAPRGLRDVGALRRELFARLRLEPATARFGDLQLSSEAVEARLEAGLLRVTPFALVSRGSRLRLEAAADLERRTLQATGRGELELRALSPLLSEAAFSGRAALDLAVGGPWQNPAVRGTLEVTDATARARSLPQALTDLFARVRFDGSRLELEEARARLGGGPVTASGGARLDSTGLRDGRFALQVREAALRYPAGLRSRIDADLQLTGGGRSWLLSGELRANRGRYDLDEALAAPVATDASEALRAIGLDLRVRADAPIQVVSDLGELQATGDLRIRGSAWAPEPLGSFRLRAGGRVFLQGREFRIDPAAQSALTYAGTWDPTLEIHAVTAERLRDAARNRETEVRLSLEGRLESPGLELSAPGYSESELLNLLATGDSRAAAGRTAAGAQAAALLLGRVGRQVRAIGLDEVRIQPELVAREGQVDPGARLTVGKQVTPWATLVYSASLQEANARYLELRAQPGVALGLGGIFDASAAGELNVSGRRRDDGGFAAGAGQTFRRGGPKSERPTDDRVTLEAVRLEGELPQGAAAAARALEQQPGARRTIWQLQDAADRAREELRRLGHVEAEVVARLDGATAVFELRPGPRFSIRVAGLRGAPDLEDVLREALDEGDLLARGEARLLERLHRDGHLRAGVEASVEPGAEGERTVRFDVTPGPRLSADVRFPGAAAVSASALLEAAGGAGALIARPEDSREALLALYREHGHLEARVGPVQVEGGSTLRIAVPVTEGPRARLAEVELAGVADEAAARQALALEVGAAWQPELLDAAAARLQAGYYRRGYPAARVGARWRIDGADVVAVVTVEEGTAVTVSGLEIEGLERTRERLVRRQAGLRTGAPLDLRQLATLEQRVLDLGIFARASASLSPDDPGRVRLSLQEGDRFFGQYELRWDEDEGASVLLDAELRNLGGFGVGLGARHRRGADVRETAASLFVPSLLLGRDRVTLRAADREEDLPVTGGGENVFRERSLALRHAIPLGRRWDVQYGYEFRHLTSTFVNVPIDIAGFDVSVLRDTRDDLLDPRRGRLLSATFEWAGEALGSDFEFVKGYAQALEARPLSPSLTWAQGLRAGLAWGLGGQRVRSSERFRAGGGNSVRGFGTDELGPRDFFGDAAGGEAVLVFNQELRFRGPAGIGAVAFWDAGQVWPAVDDVRLDLRHALGAGLRYQSAVGVLRLDVAWPLGRRPGEKPWRLHFSLGQAF
jgi:outer membrane protein assembly factor BamA/autotransporter translocation and assembly factor TamB